MKGVIVQVTTYEDPSILSGSEKGEGDPNGQEGVVTPQPPQNDVMQPADVIVMR